MKRSFFYIYFTQTLVTLHHLNVIFVHFDYVLCKMFFFSRLVLQNNWYNFRIKTKISNLVHTTRFGTTHHQVRSQNRQIGKSNNLKF